ncbi:MAG: Gfo/Idh/MocA family oxidoreductase [Deltaproteobacteria bacterium]|nr:Gfo/Idh/MocA family oxidoreductase [Deltaproteobacteria bacterium]MBW2120973.1 Gfo/Idh/MocA family oxidoreductase [Deltaproteobacteria bacterium]
MEKIKVGVVGVGYFGRFHAEKYSKIPYVELVGVADIDGSRARDVAGRFSTQPFLDYRNLFDKVQAVSVAVPTSVHYQVARDFIDHGIDVLLEKPMTTSLREAEALVERAQAQKRILQIGHLERFNSVLAALDGLVGDPLFLDSQRLSPFLERTADVDVVLDLMIHDIDIVLSIIPGEVTGIDAVGVPVVSPRLDVANARLVFESGCAANMTASRVSREKLRQITVFQKDGYFTIDFLSHVIRVNRKKEGSKGSEVVAEEIRIEPVDALEKEIRSFIEKVRDRTVPLVSGQEGKRALRIALAITEEIQKQIRKRKEPGFLDV